MSMATEILARRRKERERLGEWERAFDILRKRTSRNVPHALLFLVAGCASIWWAAKGGVTLTTDGKAVFLASSVWRLGFGALWLACGMQRLWVRADDRLLLRLLQQAAASQTPPNHVSDPTPAVTTPAGQEARRP
jgi:hypothetical protein